MKTFTLFVGNLPWSVSDDEFKGLFYNYEFANIRMIKDPMGKPKGFAYVDFDNEESMNRAMELSGREVGGRQVKIEIARSPSFSREDQPKSKTLHVGSLKYTVDERALRDLFQDSGDIADVRIVRDRNNGESKGYGFVEFHDVDSAEKGLVLNGTEIEGRAIRVSFDGGKRTFSDRGGGRGGSRGSFGGGSRGGSYGDRSGSYGGGGRSYDRRDSYSSRDYSSSRSSYGGDRDYDRGYDRSSSRRDSYDDRRGGSYRDDRESYDRSSSRH